MAIPKPSQTAGPAQTLDPAQTLNRSQALTRIQMVVHLQSVELFTHLSAEQTVRVAGIARQKILRRGETIYAKRDAAEALYCVVNGVVDLIDDGDSARRVASRDTFGVREILSGRLRNEEALVVEDGVALEIDADDFFDLLSNNIEIVKALFRQLMRPTSSETVDSAGPGTSSPGTSSPGAPTAAS